MKRIFSFVLALLLFLSCNNNREQPAGGPCSYETRTWMATVIKIDPIDSLQNDVVFNIRNENGELVRDSVSLYMENKTWLTAAELVKDSVQVGKKFKYFIDEIKTGSCNPRIEKLTLEKY